MLGPSSPATGAALAAVIVPRSAVEAAADPKRAYDLVQAVIDFVNAMTGEGLYSRGEWFHVGVGLACANGPVTEVKLKIGGGAVEEIEGRKETAFVVRTNAALRYCVVTKAHAAAYERVEHDNPPMPKFGDAEGMKQAIRDGRLARYRPPTVGRRLSHVPAETIERVIAAAKAHRAPAALDLLLRRAGIETKDASVAPLAAEPCRPAGAVVKWLVAAGGHPLFAVSRPEGSLLLRVADNQQIAAAPLADIAEHAARAEAGEVKA